MAKYIWVANKSMWTYALDTCEDYLVLDAYLKMRESGKYENTRTVKIFEWYHLREGGTLNDNILMQINGNLRREGYATLHFVNGHTTSYAAMRGQEKIAQRQKMLEQLEDMDDAQRDLFITQKKLEASQLSERISDLPVRPPTDTGLQRSEIERRRAALAAAQQRDVSVGQTKPLHPQTQPDPEPTSDEMDPESVPESTIQDNLVELISEMGELRKEVATSRQEVAALTAILQTIYRIPSPKRKSSKVKSTDKP